MLRSPNYHTTHTKSRTCQPAVRSRKGRGEKKRQGSKEEEGRETTNLLLVTGDGELSLGDHDLDGLLRSGDGVGELLHLFLGEEKGKGDEGGTGRRERKGQGGEWKGKGGQ
jgi:hypothetical protein